MIPARIAAFLLPACQSISRRQQDSTGEDGIRATSRNRNYNSHPGKLWSSAAKTRPFPCRRPIVRRHVPDRLPCQQLTFNRSPLPWERRNPVDPRIAGSEPRAAHLRQVAAAARFCGCWFSLVRPLVHSERSRQQGSFPRISIGHVRIPLRRQISNRHSAGVVAVSRGGDRQGLSDFFILRGEHRRKDCPETTVIQDKTRCFEKPAALEVEYRLRRQQTILFLTTVRTREVLHFGVGRIRKVITNAAMPGLINKVGRILTTVVDVERSTLGGRWTTSIGGSNAER